MLRKEPPAGLPAGWTFLGDTGQITIENLTARLQAGENFLIDGRFAGGSSVVSGNFWGAKEGPQRTALNVHMAAEEPVSWGAAESERWVMGISDKDLVHPPFSKPLKGVVVLTQTGLDQSWEESWRTYLRQYLGRNLITIGFPSAGITGAVSVLDLPVGGGSDHRLPHTPTGSWLTFGADTMNYKGVLLDQPLDFDEIFRAGTDDPFLAAVIKRIGGAEDAARARKRDN
jgi:hypothetical protein